MSALYVNKMNHKDSKLVYISIYINKNYIIFNQNVWYVCKNVKQSIF
jgi:hypothetical protein